MTDYCAECGMDISRPAVTKHHEPGDDLEFCSDTCYADWSFEKSMTIIRESPRIPL